MLQYSYKSVVQIIPMVALINVFTANKLIGTLFIYAACSVCILIILEQRRVDVCVEWSLNVGKVEGFGFLFVTISL